MTLIYRMIQITALLSLLAPNLNYGDCPGNLRDMAKQQKCDILTLLNVKVITGLSGACLGLSRG